MAYRLQRIIAGRGTGPERFGKALRDVSIDAAGRLFVAGDGEVKVFEATGRLLRRWTTARAPHCVAVAAGGEVLVGEPGQIERFDDTGRRLAVIRDNDRLRLPTAVARHGETLLAGDVSTRAIQRFDLSGRHLGTIGKDNRTVGFAIPNGHMDFAVDDDGVIHAVNPGKHRVERYGMDGKLLGRFGRFTGTKPEGFSGCCNPTNIALVGDGRVVVTVKAPPRAKIYGADGKLQELLGTDDFEPLCRNMDVAVDAQRRIYIADTVRLEVRVFAPQEAAEVKEGVLSGKGDERR